MSLPFPGPAPFQDHSPEYAKITSFPPMNIKPLNNNVLVRRIKKAATEETVGGIIIPQDAAPVSPTEEVEIVAISPDIKPPNGWSINAQRGDIAVIHRGLNGTSLKASDGTEYFMIGYVNLIAIVKSVAPLAPVVNIGTPFDECQCEKKEVA